MKQKEKTGVVCFGDWHGNTEFALEQLERTKSHISDSYFVHVGDFGIWGLPYDTDMLQVAGDELVEKLDAAKNTEEYRKVLDDYEVLTGFVHEVDKWLKNNDQILYVVLGNHENYLELNDSFGFSGFYVNEGKIEHGRIRTWGDHHEVVEPFPAFDGQGFITSPLYSNIRIIPRTHYWEWGGVKFASLGGANSIDKGYRVLGLSWWEEEEITAKQVESLNGVHADVLITHDCTAETAKKLHRDFQENAPSSQSALWVGEAQKITGARIVVSGHHHMRSTVKHDTYRNICLSADVTKMPSREQLFIGNCCRLDFGSIK